MVGVCVLYSMKKHPLLQHLSKKKYIQQLISDVGEIDIDTPLYISDTSSAFKHVILSLLRGQIHEKIICLTSSAEKASEVYFDLSSMIDEENTSPT
jgi:hypothetical protein